MSCLNETSGENNSESKVPGHLTGHYIHSFALQQSLVAMALHGCGNALAASVERTESLSMLILKG